MRTLLETCISRLPNPLVTPGSLKVDGVKCKARSRRMPFWSALQLIIRKLPETLDVLPVWGSGFTGLGLRGQLGSRIWGFGLYQNCRSLPRKGRTSSVQVEIDVEVDNTSRRQGLK